MYTLAGKRRRRTKGRKQERTKTKKKSLFRIATVGDDRSAASRTENGRLAILPTMSSEKENYRMMAKIDEKMTGNFARSRHVTTPFYRDIAMERVKQTTIRR
jgi:hypothetical protein